MSLFDALLLDEYHDPKDVWIAKRADGMKGSATANDPADGGTVTEPGKTAGTVEYQALTVLAYTPDPHNYDPLLDTISIQATNNLLIPSRGPFLVTNRSITKVSENAFTFTLPALPETPPDPMYSLTCLKTGGSAKTVMLFWPVVKVQLTNHGFGYFDVVKVEGHATGAFNGQLVVVGVDNSKNTEFFCQLVSIPPTTPIVTSGGTYSKIRFRFDEVMSTLTGPVSDLEDVGAIVRLGTTPPLDPFLTRGVCSAWVKDPSNPLVLPKDWVYYAGFRVKSRERIVGSGVDATIVKLVYAVDYAGSQTSLFGRLGSPEPIHDTELVDMTLDANVSGQPLAPNSKSVTAFSPAVVGGVSLYGEHLRVRRVRCKQFGTQGYHECFVFFMSGGFAAKVGATPSARGRANNVIENCIVEDPGENNTHELTPIWAHGASGGNFQGYIEANGSACAARNNFLNFRLRTGGSTYWLRVVQLETLATVGRLRVRVRTDPSIGFIRGNSHNLTLKRIRNLAGTAQHPYFTGAFPIISVTPVQSPAYEWDVVCQIFDMPPPPFWPTDPSLSYNLDHGASAGVDFHGPIAYAGTGGVVEGNATYECTNPEYTDTGSTRDVAIRNNYFSDTFTGLNQNLDPGRTFSAQSIKNTAPASPWVSWPVAGEPASVFKVVTAADHYLWPGDLVMIENVKVAGSPANSFNSMCRVTRRVDSSTFLCQVPSNVSVPTQQPDPPPYDPVPGFRMYAQTRRAVVESNQIDLYLNSQYTYAVPQGSIAVVSPQSISYVQPVVPGWVIRDNSIRHRDGIRTNMTGLFNFSRATRMYGVRDAIVETNSVDVEAPYPLEFHNPQVAVRTFQNTRPEGTLVQGANMSLTPPLRLDETLTNIDDMMTLAML